MSFLINLVRRAQWFDYSQGIKTSYSSMGLKKWSSVISSQRYRTEGLSQKQNTYTYGLLSTRRSRERKEQTWNGDRAAIWLTVKLAGIVLAVDRSMERLERREKEKMGRL